MAWVNVGSESEPVFLPDHYSSLRMVKIWKTPDEKGYIVRVWEKHGIGQGEGLRLTGKVATDLLTKLGILKPPTKTLKPEPNQETLSQE